MMITLFQDGNLLHHSLLRVLFIVEDLLFQGFDGDKMLSYLMASQVNFSKRPTSEHSSNSVVATGTTLHLSILLKVLSDILFQINDISLVLLNLHNHRVFSFFIVYFLFGTFGSFLMNAVELFAFGHEFVINIKGGLVNEIGFMLRFSLLHLFFNIIKGE